MLNRNIAPKIKDAVDYTLNLKPYDFFCLDNGIKVYSVNTGAQEVLQLELVFYAGNCFEKQKNVATATNFLLKNGTTSRNAFQLNEAFDYYGGYCTRTCFNETAVVNLHCLTKHADKMFPVMLDMLTESVFPEEELEIYKQQSLQRLKVNLRKAEFVAGRLIDSYIYGEHHPYGVYTHASDIDTLNTSACRKFYQEHYINGHCIIFVSGKFDSGLIDLLNTHFGKLKTVATKPEIPSVKSIPSTERIYRIHNDPDAVQGAIRLARPFPNRHHPDFRKVMILNTLYGGFFGSRLMSNIREDKGYTYGIYSYIQNHIQESAWVISTEAGRDVAEAAIKEIYHEMERLRENLIQDDELLLVRNYMMGGILGELDGPFQIMGKWKNIILNGMDDNYFYESVNEIKSITSEELRALAVKYLQPEMFKELVVY